MSRVRVKFCGVTGAADAEAAIALGVDALGFNTWPGSSRHLDLATAAGWLRDLPPFVCRVALTVNAPLEEARQVAELPYIDAVQLHGDEDAEYCRRLSEVGRPVIKALRLRGAGDLAAAGDFPTLHLLIDAHVEGQFGGTGAPVDLELAAEFCRRYPERRPILAGGLKPENVAASIRAVRPYAVDVSSGVESSPGRKDPERMRAFMAAVGEA